MRIILVNFSFSFFFFFVSNTLQELLSKNNLTFKFQSSVISTQLFFDLRTRSFTLSRKRRWENEFFLHGSSSSLWQKHHAMSSFIRSPRFFSERGENFPRLMEPFSPILVSPDAHRRFLFPLSLHVESMRLLSAGREAVFRAKLNV